MEVETPFAQEEQSLFVCSKSKKILGNCFFASHSSCLFVAPPKKAIPSDIDFQQIFRSSETDTEVVRKSQVIGVDCLHQNLFHLILDSNNDMELLISSFPFVTISANSILTFSLKFKNSFQPIETSNLFEKNKQLFFKTKLLLESNLKLLGSPVFASDSPSGRFVNKPIGVVLEETHESGEKRELICLVFTQRSQLEIFESLRATLTPGILESPSISKIQKNTHEFLAGLYDPTIIHEENTIGELPKVDLDSKISADSFIQKKEVYLGKKLCPFAPFVYYFQMSIISPSDLFNSLDSLVPFLAQSKNKENQALTSFYLRIFRIIQRFFKPNKKHRLLICSEEHELNFSNEKDQCCFLLELKNKTAKSFIESIKKMNSAPGSPQVFKVDLVIDDQSTTNELLDYLEENEETLKGLFKKTKKLGLTVKTKKETKNENYSDLFSISHSSIWDGVERFLEFFKKSLASLSLTVEDIGSFDKKEELMAKIFSSFPYLASFEVVLRSSGSKTELFHGRNEVELEKFLNFNEMKTSANADQLKYWEYFSITVDIPFLSQKFPVNHFKSFLQNATSLEKFHLFLKVRELEPKRDKEDLISNSKNTFMKCLDLGIEFTNFKENQSKSVVNDEFLAALHGSLTSAENLEKFRLNVTDQKQQTQTKKFSQNLVISDVGIIKFFPFKATDFLKNLKELTFHLNHGKLKMSEPSLYAIASVIKKGGLDKVSLGFL